MFVLHRRSDILVYIVDWSIATLQPVNESKKVQHAMTEEIPITAIFGPVPDGLDLAEDQRLGHNVSVAALLIIATIGVALRIAARVVQKSGLQADDYLIIVALSFGYATGGLSIAGIFCNYLSHLLNELTRAPGGNYGAGRHVWALDVTDLVTMYQILYAYTYIYAAAVATTKLSILLFYGRIFKYDGRWWQIVLAISFFLTLSIPLIIWITMANACKPVSFFWNQFIGAEGKCIDINAFFLALGIMNMLVDVVVLVVPIPRILALNMTARKKWGVSGILLLGGFVCVASIVRINELAKFSKAIDVTWHMGPVFIWSSVEPSIGIFSACLPNLRPLWVIFRDKVSSYHASTSNNEQSHNLNQPSAEYTIGQKSSRNHKFRRDEDEISLTTVAFGDQDTPDVVHRGILVRSEFDQTSDQRR